MARNTKSNRSSRKPNTLRIIGGQWRGRKLHFPDLPGLRPTPDRVRETLFNWLSPKIHNARCLDLFSGSGALSLEALSRGAGHTTIIDRAPQVTAQLQQHLDTLVCNSAKLITADSIQWLSRIKPGQLAPFDIIFLDPPFHQGLIENCCNSLEQLQLVTYEGIIYIETETSWDPVFPESWELYRSKRSGQVASYLCINQSQPSTKHLRIDDELGTIA